MSFKTRKQLKKEIEDLQHQSAFILAENINLKREKEILWRMHCERYCPIYKQRGYIDTQLCCDYYQCPVCIAALFGKEPE